jgi:hypothetical protein
MFLSCKSWEFCCYVVTGPVKLATNETQVNRQSCFSEALAW